MIQNTGKNVVYVKKNKMKKIIHHQQLGKMMAQTIGMNVQYVQMSN